MTKWHHSPQWRLTTGHPLLLWHLTLSKTSSLQSQKNRKNIGCDSRRYEWPHGKCSAGNVKWGVSHHLSPSLSHYTSTAHACFDVCVRVCVCACVFIVLTLTVLNVLCNTLCATVWIYYIFHDEENVSWPCKMLRESWTVFLFFLFFLCVSVCTSGNWFWCW